MQLVARLSKSCTANQLFALANSYRQNHALPALVKDDTMLPASRAHASDMWQHHFMGHTASTGRDFDNRMRALRGCAMVLPPMHENAMIRKSKQMPTKGLAQKLFQSWVSGLDHRHTLLSRDYLSGHKPHRDLDRPNLHWARRDNEYAEIAIVINTFRLLLYPREREQGGAEKEGLSQPQSCSPPPSQLFNINALCNALLPSTMTEMEPLI